MSGIVEKMRSQLALALEKAVEKAVEKGTIPSVTVPEFVVEVPREKGHGDFATNLAMMLARPAKNAPRKLADIIVENFELADVPVQKVEIAGPGFINFYLEPTWIYQALEEIEEQGAHYGRLEMGAGTKVQVEFVSANPTGLLHMGNARGAALGDSIASILDFAGYEVQREYYINDAGNQIENFGKSLEARYLQQLGQEVPLPEDGYHGEDLIETVKNFIAQYKDSYLTADAASRRSKLVEFALKEKLTDIKNSLLDFGVVYDVWFSEQSLHQGGLVDKTLAELKERGYLYQEQEALWFKATAFGDEKDEVVVRSNGIPTYFAADIAYHKNKFDRGFNKVINIWGADHHGHVNRMKGAIEALGYSRDALEVVLMQLVRLLRGGEVVRMSKRTGQFVTLAELIEEVGKDAARYFFVMRSPDSHLEFDLDLAKSQSNDNPVFYIQYAHARICSIFRQLEEQGRKKPRAAEVDLKVLKEEPEQDLIRKLADFPVEVSMAAQMLAPHRIARYLHDLASAFHSFYNSHRVIVEDPQISNARLVLVNCTRIVLKNALRLIGVSAPERM
ncbi:arginine--tRNA ligase [Desulfofalx alkaliphila]|uniref:arginine--tRNA ligase n=1 Tax=Desulfofalx alkaliphila TaxID=105483 RepID=UPI0004E224E3|nr:arginine--tRNA ligase [Desulfofalx alkaliphila]